MSEDRWLLHTTAPGQRPHTLARAALVGGDLAIVVLLAGLGAHRRGCLWWVSHDASKIQVLFSVAGGSGTRRAAPPAEIREKRRRRQVQPGGPCPASPPSVGPTGRPAVSRRTCPPPSWRPRPPRCGHETAGWRPQGDGGFYRSPQKGALYDLV